MKTLLLSKNDVREVLSMDIVIDAVADAYRAFQRGSVDQPPIQTLDMREHNAESDIKSCYNRDNSCFSIKTVGLFQDNAKGAGPYTTTEGEKLPNMMGNVILGDGKTGATLAIMDASLITGIRTGAAGALSCKYLAREDAKVAAVFGAGAQARMQAYALAKVRKIEEFRAYDKFAGPELMAAYQADVERETGARVVLCGSVEEAAAGADILICPTPSREAYLKPEYVKPGMHIVEVGVDVEGKAEVEPAVFAKCDKIVCDSISQCVTRGETRNAILGGAIQEADIYGEIGEIVLGLKPGRESAEEITLFDTTGMGVQDNTTAVICYQTAVEKGLGSWFEFI
ncbi:MAG: ornithine cyclodeaminase family protein [Clostridia bacterium]|nr:ornithine cyclodeaminase family protein [Clostridia bacterium]